MPTIVFVILFVPLVWSAALAGLRRLFDAGTTGSRPDDVTEKRLLVLMLAPILIGIAVVIGGRFVPAGLPLPRIDFAGGEGLGTLPTVGVEAVPEPKGLDWLPLALRTLVAVYAGVALFNTIRLSAQFIRLARLVAAARPDATLGEGVRLTDAATPPLAWGSRTILVPQGLAAAISPRQLDLILRHERAHLNRSDTLWFATLAWVDALFWFNLFIRRQTARCRLAAELACDAAALGAAPEMQETYADALLKVLRHTAGDVRQYAPAAFSPEKSGDYRMRLTEIMQPASAPRKPRLVMIGLAAVLVLPLAVAQFAWSQTSGPAEVKLSVVPVAGGISSGFGMRLNPITHEQAFHSGVDFKTAIGQPVKAAGAGKVSNVYNDRYHMGQVIEIDHGGGLTTRYTHLGAPQVKTGDSITAGQTIATTGNSGVTTGPHTHFEVWKDGKAVDPATVLPLPKVG